MNQKIKVAILGVVVFVVIGVVAALMVISFLKPSDEVMDLATYYGNVTKDNAVLVLEDTIQDERVTYKDGEVYLKLDMVCSELNGRFYWDANEELLIYTLPEDIIEAKLDSKSYSVNGKEEDYGKTILIKEEGFVWVSLSFVEKYSNIKSKVYSDPNRVVINNKWDEDILVATAKQETQIRYEGSSKSSILKELAQGDKVRFIMEDNTSLSKGYVKVMSEDGIIGYVKDTHLNDSEYEKQVSDFKEPEYTSVKRDYPINLTWNAVSNEVANSMVGELLDNTSGVNTISPTWFSLADTEGNINSLASHTYVEEVHGRGVEVWALVDDFTTDVNVKDVISKTSSRRNLINNLVKEVVEYDIDGINVDFESIKAEFAADYIQFIRELSIQCRKEKIVLSVDSYVPMPYSKFYNRTEQGIVADYVIIMAYDEYYAGSPTSGSVASISWIETAVNATMEQVEDKSKIVIAIPFYSRLWEESMNSDGSTTVVSSKAIIMTEINSLLSENGAVSSWDEKTKQEYAEYTKDGHLYKIWVENERSLEAKLNVIKQAKIGGVASWRLGFEPKTVWPLIEDCLR